MGDMKLSFPQKMHYCTSVILPTFYLAPWVSPVSCYRITVIHKTQLYWLETRGYNYRRSTFLGSYFYFFFIASDRNCLFKFYDYILCQYNPIKNFVRLYFEREGKNNVTLTQTIFRKGNLRSLFLLKSYWSEVKVAQFCLTLHSPWNSPGQNTGVGN